jgi:neutral amino acid transport system ATP-binding protein
MTLLEVVDLHAGYAGSEILHGVSASVAAGEIVTVIGPNGAGKSTLVKAIIGILKPTRGTVRFRGADITGRDPEILVEEGLSYVPQVRNIFPSLTVLENLEMGAIPARPGWLHLLGKRAGRLMPWARGGDRRDLVREGRLPITEDTFDQRVAGLTRLFPNLETKLRQRAGALSGGEQQMVALAKALILEPVVLLVDEPSSGLAPKLQAMIFEKIRDINEQGTAIVLVEQNAKKALAMADRGYVLEMGRNRYEGKGEALLLDPEVGRLYLGG